MKTGTNFPTNSNITTMEPSKIAVTGMACKFPGASSPLELFMEACAGRQQFRKFLPNRFSLGNYHSKDSSEEDKTICSEAAFIDGYENEHCKSHFSNQDIETSDTTHWLAIETVNTLPKSILGKQLPKKTGVIVGNTLTGEKARVSGLRTRLPLMSLMISEACHNKNIDEQIIDKVIDEFESIYKTQFKEYCSDTLAGNLSNTISGRICNHLKINGGCFTIDGACASSLLAVYMAILFLETGNWDAAIVTGVDVSLDQFELIGFSKIGVLTSDEMKVYDVNSSGFKPGEGCGVVVLKRLEDAKRDGDTIYAVIDGYGISSDGNLSGRRTVMAPSNEGQQMAGQNALLMAGVTMKDVHFVEGHGTGTKEGDLQEIIGLGKLQGMSNVPHRSIPITSLKSNIGHTKAASGIGGLIKSIVSVNNRCVPPVAGSTSRCTTFETVQGLYPALCGESLHVEGPIRACVQSMGFGGVNVQLTLTSPSTDTVPEIIKSKIPIQHLLLSPQDSELFVISATSVNEMDAKIDQLLRDVEYISNGELVDLAYSLVKNNFNICHTVKAAFVVNNKNSLQEHLMTIKALNSGDVKHSEIKLDQVFYMDNSARNCTGTNLKICFLFPGQGSISLNSVRTLGNRIDVCRDVIAIFDKLMLQRHGRTLSSYCFRDRSKCETEKQWSDWSRELASSKIHQPAIVMTNIILVEFLTKVIEIRPSQVGGHSLSEIVALYTAGYIDLETAAFLSIERGDAFQQCDEGKMAVLKCDSNMAQLVIEGCEKTYIANFNSPKQLVISGKKQGVDTAIHRAKEHNIQVIELNNIKGAFHTPLMKPVADSFYQAISHYEFKRPPTLSSDITPSFFSSSTGTLINFEDLDIATHLKYQIFSQVQFQKMISIMASSCDLFVEVGAGGILTNLCKEINPLIPCMPTEQVADSWKSINILMAYLCVHGFNAQYSKLFMNRYIRSDYVPFQDRKGVISNSAEQYISSRPPMKRKNIASSSSPSQRPSITLQIIQDTLLTTFKEQISGRSEITLESKFVTDLEIDSTIVRTVIAAVVRKLKLSNFSAENYSDQSISEVAQDMLRFYNGDTEDTPPNWTKSFIPRRQVIARCPLSGEFYSNNVPILIFCNYLKDGQLLRDQLKLLGYIDITLQDNIPTENDSAQYDIVICLLTQKHFEPLEVLNQASRALKMVSPKGHLLFIHQPDVALKSFAGSLHFENASLHIGHFEINSADWEVITAECIRCFQGKSKWYSRIIDQHGIYETVLELDMTPRLLISWNSKDVILVTGGMKGITAKCITALSTHLKHKGIASPTFICLGTSGEDTITKEMSLFRCENVKVEYHSCDITDKSQVTKLMKKLNNHHTISGFIHGAGRNQNILGKNMSQSMDSVENICKVKIDGFQHVVEHLNPNALKIVILLSSIIGLTGMEGNSAYAFANEQASVSLKAYSQKHEVPGVSIAYSVWKQFGMGEKMNAIDYLKKKGINAIPVDEGVRKFIQYASTHSSDHFEHVIVTSRIRVSSIDTWKMSPYEFPKPTKSLFLEHFQVFPGVEAISDIEISLDNHQFLKDHVWNGSPLFPGVFGLEAMFEVSNMALLSYSSFSKMKICRIENIVFTGAIIVYNAVTIRIMATVRDEELDQCGEIAVEARIRVKDDHFQKDCFTALFIFRKEIPRTLECQKSIISQYSTSFDETSQIHMSRDVYEPGILFHGKKFQCIKTVYNLNVNQDETKGFVSFAVAPHINEEKQDFLLGNPFLRDSLIQSCQLVIPKYQCLPVAINKIELTSFNMPSCSQELQAMTFVSSQSKYSFLSDTFVFDKNGQLIEKIMGLETRKVSTNNAFPPCGALIDPVLYDKKILDEHLARLVQELKINLPNLHLYHIRYRNCELRDNRHQFQEEIISKLVPGAKLSWNEYGKPLISLPTLQNHDPRENHKYLSFSTDQNKDVMLVCIDNMPQGCDIVEIQPSKPLEGSLGDHDMQLVTELEKEDLTKHEASYSIHCAQECFIKYRNAELCQKSYLQICAIHGNSILFQDATTHAYCVTFIVKLAWGLPKVIGCIVKEFNSVGAPQSSSEDQICSLPPSVSISKKHLDCIQTRSPNVYDLDAELNMQRKIFGPSQRWKFAPGFPRHLFHFDVIEALFAQRQPALLMRMPLSMQDITTTAQTVSFEYYIGVVMGKAREWGSFEIYHQFPKLSFSLVTNYASVKVLGEMELIDVVRVHMWQGPLERGGTFHMLKFDIMKITEGGHHERVAQAELGFTFAKEAGYGKAQSSLYPEHISLHDRINDTRYGDLDANANQLTYLGVVPPEEFKHLPDTLPILPASLASLHDEVEQNAFTAISAKEQFVYKVEFLSCRSDTNFARNIYFANYAKWQRNAIEKYLFQLDPRIFREGIVFGEWITLVANVNHLQEAMPFDFIRVSVYLSKVGEFWLSFDIHFFKKENDDTWIKIAMGSQTVVFAERDKNNRRSVKKKNFSNEIREKLVKHFVKHDQ